MSITLKKENFAVSRLASGMGASDTSLAVTTGQGALFPTGGPFRAVLWGANYSSPASDPNREVVEAALVSGDSFTITRAREGTTACAWSASDNIALTITKAVLEEYESDLSSFDGRLATAESGIAANASGVAQNSADIYALDTRVDALESFSGALLSRTSTQSVPSGAWTSVQFNAESYDTDGFHSTLSNTERLTVPAGLGRARLKGNVFISSNPTGFRSVRITKNGGSGVGLPEDLRNAAASAQTNVVVASAALEVSEGDYFELQVYQNSGVTLSVNPNSWLSMEALK